MNNQDKIELEKWMKAESPLVTFARSLRMENTPSGSSDSGKTSEGNADAPASLLDGLDLDTIPKDVRDALVTKDTEYKQSLDAKTKLERANSELTQRVATHQSRADRAIGRLSAHNIPLDGPIEDNSGAPEDKQLIKDLTDAFVEEGLDPKIAAVYAKVHAKSAPILEKRMGSNIGRNLAPMVQVIGNMKADQLLEQAIANDPTGAFQDEEIYQGVVDSVKIMTQAGNAIDKATIQSLLHMEIGKKVAAGKDIMQTKKDTTSTRFSTRMSGGGGILPNRNLDNGDGKPRAVNSDTEAAVNATTAAMLRGTGIVVKK